MSPQLEPLARSDSKARFFQRLGLSLNQDSHNQLYELMKVGLMMQVKMVETPLAFHAERGLGSTRSDFEQSRQLTSTAERRHQRESSEKSKGIWSNTNTTRSGRLIRTSRSANQQFMPRFCVCIEKHLCRPSLSTRKATTPKASMRRTGLYDGCCVGTVVKQLTLLN
jgi:hypothetical protein